MKYKPAKIKTSFSRKVFVLINSILLIGVGLACFLPMWHVLVSSISDPAEISKNEKFLFWILGNPTLKGYDLVFQNKNIFNGYVNTFVQLFVSLAFSMVLTTLGAFVLSRKNVKLMPVMTFLITFTMLFSGGLIPFYMVVRNLGWIDTIWGVTIPGCVSVYNMIIMRTSFRQIPDALEESARLDGAGDITILIHIILPLSKAVLAVIVLFYAVSKWNAWFYPMIFLRDRSKYPLQVFLRELLVQQNQSQVTMQGETMTSDMEKYRSLIQYCTIIVATLPILCIYPFVQKYFVTGVMLGSVKG